LFYFWKNEPTEAKSSIKFGKKSIKIYHQSPSATLQCECNVVPMSVRFILAAFQSFWRSITWKLRSLRLHGHYTASAWARRHLHMFCAFLVLAEKRLRCNWWLGSHIAHTSTTWFACWVRVEVCKTSCWEAETQFHTGSVWPKWLFACLLWELWILRSLWR